MCGQRPQVPQGMAHQQQHGVDTAGSSQDDARRTIRRLRESRGRKLYEEYRQGGGEDQENGLIRKITLFARICESEGLLKPTGARWLSEEEVWDCWEAFSGSESEAKRVCTAMEKVLIPLKQELEEEPARQEKIARVIRQDFSATVPGNPLPVRDGALIIHAPRAIGHWGTSVTNSPSSM